MEELRLTNKEYQIPNRGIATVNDNYPNTFNAKSFLEQRDETYVYTDNFVVISSNDREASRYPLHFSYNVDLVSTYKNVVSVSVLSATLPNTTGVFNEPYLILSINELDHIDFGTLSNNNKGFAMLPLKGPSQTTGGFIVPDLAACCNSQALFKTPLARLSRLTIKIKDYSSVLFSFGKPSGSVLKADQHSFMLKITTRELSREALGNRNAY
jgi:hypothetical protein